MLPDLTVEELVAGLDWVAENTLAGTGITMPPVDAFQLARALGITIAWDERQTCRARYVRLGGRESRKHRAVILLRPDPRPERLHWAVAHELGEHLAWRVFERWRVEPCELSAETREHTANCLARRLLLPSRWFAVDGQSLGWDLWALKARYHTASHELIARRMLDFRPPIIISIFDQDRLHFRRSNFPHRPPLTSVERRCRRRVHNSGRPMWANFSQGFIQGWPVHEPGWKREILRMEIQCSMDE